MAVVDYSRLSATPATVAAAVAGSLVVYWVLSAVRTWYRLRQFPGPPLAGWTYLWNGWAATSGQMPYVHMGVRKKYGSPLVRVGPNVLVTDDPDVIRRMNGVRSGYGKAPSYTGFRMDPYVHNMISSHDLAFHDDIKSRASAGYSGKDVPTFERDIDSQIDALKALLRRKYLSDAAHTRPVDWGFAAQYFTLDVLTKVAFGEAFGCLAEDDDVNGYIHTMEEIGFITALATDVPWIGRMLFSKTMLRLAGPKKTDKKGIGMMLGLAERLVSGRFAPDSKDDQTDMLASFKRHGMEQRQIQSEVLLQVVAGSDTTATAIRMTVFFLATNPQAYARLQKEIDDGIAAGKISTPITNAEGKALPYLQAVVRESIRFHPPVFNLLPKVVPPGGDTLCGRFVPGGTEIGVNPWSMVRRPEIFGDDPDVFRPERWLEAPPERRAEMEKVGELIFGHGRFMCAGKVLAFMELNKTFVELLRDFDFQVVDPQHPFSEQHLALFHIRKMYLRVTEREKKKN